MRLCALLRAIVMRLNSLDGKRKRMSRVYNYVSALVSVMQDFELNDNVLIVKVNYDTKYAVTKEGRVYAVKGKKLVELNEVEELEAMKKLEEFILSKAKALATRIGVNTDRILNPLPKKQPSTKKQKPKAEG